MLNLPLTNYIPHSPFPVRQQTTKQNVSVAPRSWSINNHGGRRNHHRQNCQSRISDSPLCTRMGRSSGEWDPTRASKGESNLNGSGLVYYVQSWTSNSSASAPVINKLLSLKLCKLITSTLCRLCLVGTLKHTISTPFWTTKSWS